MSQEKKKIERVVPPRPEPKKREVKVDVPIVVKEEPKVEPEVKKTKAKAVDKYLRFSFKELSDSNNMHTINRRVLAGEIKLAYYATDNDIGYHYYLIINN